MELKRENEGSKLLNLPILLNVCFCSREGEDKLSERRERKRKKKKKSNKCRHMDFFHRCRLHTCIIWTKSNRQKLQLRRQYADQGGQNTSLRGPAGPSKMSTLSPLPEGDIDFSFWNKKKHLHGRNWLFGITKICPRTGLDNVRREKKSVASRVACTKALIMLRHF